MAAEHPREGITCQHGPLAGAAACDYIVRRSRIKENRRQNPVLHVGERIGILRRIHPVIEHLMSHGLHHAL